MTTVNEIEEEARADYERARKIVRGRPKWEDLDPNDAYDMGMRETAYARAMINIAKTKKKNAINKLHEGSESI